MTARNEKRLTWFGVLVITALWTGFIISLCR